MCDLRGTAFGRDWCAAHYYRWKKHGDPLRGGEVVRPRALTSEADVFDWFMPGKPPVSPSAHEGCWDWNAGTRNGVGVFSLNGKTLAADEAAYRRYRGAIPEGLQVIQTCGRRDLRATSALTRRHATAQIGEHLHLDRHPH